MTRPLRLRFAPSPTGRLHIGGARTALFNWAYARGRGGAFLLRIEDTDRERSTPEHERAILEGLRWLGLDWDEGPEVGGPHAPYRQSERGELYARQVERLRASGAAYPCFCDAERLDGLRERQTAGKQRIAYDRRCAGLAPDEAARRIAAGEAHVLRFRVPAGETRFVDLVRGDVRFDNVEVDDWIMVRSDGAPTYNFVVVCDDIDMAVSHVVRGEEHLVNTPKQVLLYDALGAEPPEFAHLPLMLGTDGKKLSKRTGDTALQDYQDHGYPRAAIVNFLSLQGWALDGATEVFSVEQLVANFDLRAVSKGGSIFDLDKFRWLAGEYIRREPLEELVEHVRPFVLAAGLCDAQRLVARADWFRELVRGEQERIATYADLPERVAWAFAADEEVVYDPKAEAGARKHADASRTLHEYADWLAERLAADARPPELGDATKVWVTERGARIPALFQPLRCALTGAAGGRDLFEIVDLLGPESALARIRAGARRLAVPA
ncbi:MAG TPA: glutamate--tRNA ligase [Planctomycetota bacterium]|nr:glutamate--tRNA ligase [Planctomycetota bacterium]